MLSLPYKTLERQLEKKGSCFSYHTWGFSSSACVGVTAVPQEDSKDTSLDEILGNLTNATTSHSGVDSRNYQFHNRKLKHRTCPWRSCTFPGLAAGFSVLHLGLFAEFSFPSCMALEVGPRLGTYDLVQNSSLLPNFYSLRLNPRSFWPSQDLGEDTAEPLIFSLPVHSNEKINDQRERISPSGCSVSQQEQSFWKSPPRPAKLQLKTGEAAAYKAR